jgi:hypothetical protein
MGMGMGARVRGGFIVLRNLSSIDVRVVKLACDGRRSSLIIIGRGCMDVRQNRFLWD